MLFVFQIKGVRVDTKLIENKILLQYIASKTFVLNFCYVWMTAFKMTCQKINSIIFELEAVTV